MSNLAAMLSVLANAYDLTLLSGTLLMTANNQLIIIE